MKRPALVLALATALFVALPARADEPPVVRRGFTGEAGASLGVMHVEDDDAASSRGTYGGFLPVVVSAGAFITRAVALRAHAAAATYIFETGTATSERVLGYVGPEAQVWLRDDVNVGGGVGAAMWDPGDARPFGSRYVLGWGFSLFAKWSFVRLPHQAVSLGVEVIPTFLPRAPTSVVAYGLGLSWQYY